MDLAKATAYAVLKRGYYRKGERLVFQKLVK
jgi:hypothetical protein